MAVSMPSIFNDILGPIMLGPSSSHTCAPARIGYLAGQLLRGGPARAEVSFKHDGSFTHSYKGQRSDVAFLGGMLGIREHDERLRRAYDEARAAGVDVAFVIEEGMPEKPNFVTLRLWAGDGEHVVVNADSTGGGTLTLFRINDFGVEIRGDAYEVLLFCPVRDAERVAVAAGERYPEAEAISVSLNGERGLVNVKLRHPPDENELAGLFTGRFDCKARVLKPVHPVLINSKAALPFRRAGEMLPQAQGRSLGELGIAYEMARSGWSRGQLEDRMDEVIRVMEGAAEKGVSGRVSKSGVLTPCAPRIADNVGGLDLGALNVAVPWAMGVMEANSNMGLVVGGPTGGSAGIIPGAVLGIAGHMNAPVERKRMALFAAGMAGILLAGGGCNYSAELFGCQVEVGAASALAAAGLVELSGGTARQACDATATAIHNVLGLICDPVAGLVELPCISRNAMGVSNAAVCANLIMGGYDPLIGLDESVRVMVQVGTDLPSKLRCTGKGGLCVSPTGLRLYAEQKERDRLR